MAFPTSSSRHLVAMKTIHRPEDLAIMGAPPAYDKPLHVGRPNLGDRDKFLRLAGEIFDSRHLTNNGPKVRELEARLADFLGVRHCIAICNGTIALEIAIRALDLTGEVIVPSYTFVATAHSLWWQGITPVFADIDPATHNLDPVAVERAITPRTSGIIGVHLWGRPAAIDELQAIADRHDLALLFDAAHAFGCSYRGRRIGAFGRCEVLSFHATKAFNTFEGGAITTDDDVLAEKVRLMRNFGFAGFDNVIHVGTNGKMIEACAAMGLVNLEAFPSVVEANRRNQAAYREAMSDLPWLRLVGYDGGEECNYHYVVAELADDAPVSRDALVEALQAENILARKYFWPGCHRMQPYLDLFPNAGSTLPETERVAARVVVLPNGITLPESAPAVIAAICRQLASMKGRT